METKESKKNVVVAVVITVLVMIILIMGYFMYQMYTEKNAANSKVSELNSRAAELKNEQTISNNVNDEQENTSNYSENIYSFEKIMNMIYLKKFTKDSKEYSPNRIGNVTVMASGNTSDNIDVEVCGVYVYQESNLVEINFYDSEKNINKDYSITGIDGEVVSIVVLPFEAEITPNYIYALTREGNVYYAKNMKDITAFSDLKAKKIENISNIISITSTSTIDEATQEGYANVIATNYNGENIILADYID